MENSHESYTNGDLTDPGRQIMRHSLYRLSRIFSLPWFDIRVLYVRISNFLVDNSTPEYLTFNHISLRADTVLEVNGARCSIDSEGISCILRRDRLDKKSEEATFVSTDSIRLTGSVKFEVFDQEDLVISGAIELSNANGCSGESHNTKKWSMDCEAEITAGSGFLKVKQTMGPESSSPTIEVYIAGSFSGTPIVLTKMLQLTHRRKQRKAMLNSIPEYDAYETREDVTSTQDLQVAEYRNHKFESEEEYDNLYWREGHEYMEDESGELSWFNAGVRVGVGIGLGVCLGVGVGVGLLVRACQTTTRTFKRHLM